MRNILIALLLITVAGHSLFSQARKYSNEFLSIGVSARSLGMGNANVASVSDVTSGYWNPAGLNEVSNDFQVGLMHAEYFAGIANYDYAAVAIPLKDRSRKLGLSLIRFAVDDIPNTLQLIEPDGSVNYNNITSFSVADYAFLISYAQPIAVEHLQVGASVKVIHRTAGSFAKAWGFGIDLGAKYVKDNWRFGLMARDITTTFNAWSFNFSEQDKAVFAQTNNVIPDNSYELTLPKLIAGAAYAYTITDRLGLLAEINLDITTDGKRNVLVSASPFSIDPHAGLELNYNQFIFLRAGAGYLQRKYNDATGEQAFTMQPNLGVGLIVKNLGIDYAYTNIGDPSQALYSHVFSLRLEFDKSN
jgi:hypothetical protein